MRSNRRFTRLPHRGDDVGRFSAGDMAAGCLELRIEAWAPGGDRVSNMLFDRIGISKEVQLHTWTSVLARLTDLTGGRR